MPEIAEVWREGHIIRSAVLNQMAAVFRGHHNRNPLFTDDFADMVASRHVTFRKVASVAALAGLPVPSLSAAPGYFGSIRTERSTANMIQARRELFGAHGFERVDAKGAYHGLWGQWSPGRPIPPQCEGAFEQAQRLPLLGRACAV